MRALPGRADHGPGIGIRRWDTEAEGRGGAVTEAAGRPRRWHEAYVSEEATYGPGGPGRLVDAVAAAIATSPIAK